ncbi:Peroxisomal 2,4-dienoyl-CoA reductase SPS19 [Fonsecaea pedrosoi]|nr:Peroxisomal 2,4-dienoyl-CoA reductase SPS19 [Fonsecaea pedrosoi]
MPLEKHQYLSEVWKGNLFVDKVVFCTGGNGSICSAQVRALVHLGANACIVGRNVEKTQSVAKDIATARPGSKVLGIGAVDVRNVENLEAAVKQCVEELGGIDFLIAGAAGNFLAPISQLSPNAFKSCYHTSWRPARSITPRRPCPNLWGGPGGRIIYVSATIHYTGAALQAHVAVAKSGVDALSANVAIEYGPLGVTSNVIAPGPIAGTHGMDRLSKEHYAGQTAGRTIPLGRWGSIKEIADATVFLFSDAGNYVNGEVLVVDGGAWRTGAGSPGYGNFEYPEFLLSGAEVTGVGGSRKRQREPKL